MRKLLLILVLCMGLQGAAHAQYYFNNRETLHSFASTLTSVVPRDGLYYCTGVCIDSSNGTGGGGTNNVEGARFVIFDSTGQIIRDTVYQLPFVRNLYAWNNSLYPMPDKGFVYALGQDIDTDGIARMMIVRYDSTGNVEWTKEYNAPFCSGAIFYRIKDMKPTGTGEWLTLATLDCRINSTTVRSNMILTKLDSNFNEEWSREFGNSNTDNIAGRLLIDPDGYVLGGSFLDRYQHVNYTYRAELIKTDTAGNQLWRWLSDGSKKICTAVSMDLIRTKDGGYMYCGQGDGIESSGGGGGWDDIRFIGWVEKIDSNRNEVWGKRYGAFTNNTGFNVIKETDSGDLYLFGYRYEPVQLTPTTGLAHIKGWLMHLDANGDSVDERTYYKVSTCNDNNTFYDAKPTTDGGWVMVGESSDECVSTPSPIQQGWIVKTDGDGCLGLNDTQCHPVAVHELTKQDNFKLYPNPGRGNFTLISPCLSPGDELRIYNVMGQEVYSAKISSAKQTFSIDVPAGVYVAEVMDDSGGRYVQRLVVER